MFVDGHQYWWEFRYPGHNVVTANELHLPVGQRARFTLLSADTDHEARDRATYTNV